MLTYGDGLSDLDVNKLLAHHERSKKLCTLTAIRPAGRWGLLEIGEHDVIERFMEKPQGDGGYINGGFFVVEPEVLDRIKGDNTVWEREPLEGLAQDRQLSAFKYDGFWAAMDTLRDKNYLEGLWSQGNAPWKKW